MLFPVLSHFLIDLKHFLIDFFAWLTLFYLLSLKFLDFLHGNFSSSGKMLLSLDLHEIFIPWLWNEIFRKKFLYYIQASFIVLKAMCYMTSAINHSFTPIFRLRSSWNNNVIKENKQTFHFLHIPNYETVSLPSMCPLR